MTENDIETMEIGCKVEKVEFRFDEFSKKFKYFKSEFLEFLGVKDEKYCFGSEIGKSQFLSMSKDFLLEDINEVSQKWHKDDWVIYILKMK